MDVVWDRPAGARMSAFGEGKDVRCGFWDSAASMAFADDDGVMSCISSISVRIRLLESDEKTAVCKT